ncbi:MAG: ADOP family duplicated permease [Gemmatimonadales bacterium]
MRVAFRSLARTPAFLATALLTIGLSVGTAATAFGVIDAVRFRALPFKNGDRLVLLSEVASNPGARAAGGRPCTIACDMQYVTYAALRPLRFRTLDMVAAYGAGLKTMDVMGDPVPVLAGVVSENLFDLLDVRPLLGRGITAEDNRVGARDVAVLSHDLWMTRFGGEPSVIGRGVKFSEKVFTVVGVMPPGFEFETGVKLWIPAVPTLDPSNRPSIHNITVVGRLAPGQTVAQARVELGALPVAQLRANVSAANELTHIEVAPLRERYVAATQSRDLIFAIIVACTMLIACANLVNLALLRALRQQREFAIRAALGARTGDLTRVLLAQYLIVTAGGLVLGLMLAQSMLGVLQSSAALGPPRPVGMEYRIDYSLVAFAALVAAGIAVALSAIPARLITRIDVQKVLQSSTGGASAGRWTGRAQRLFVVAQVACAAVLLTAGGFMTVTVLRLGRMDLGIPYGQLVYGSPSYPHAMRTKDLYLPLTERVVAALQALPGAGGVGVLATLPLQHAGTTNITLDGAAEPLAQSLVPPSSISVNETYFDAIGAPIVRGRSFATFDREETPPVAIVNEWAARHWWPGADAVGKVIRLDTAATGSIELTIVGVVKDNKAAAQNILTSEVGPELYRPYLQASSAFPSFYVRAASLPAQLVRPVRETLARLVPDRPVFTSTVLDQVNSQFKGVRLDAEQTLGFALLGLTLALIGIYGVLSYSVGQRTREIAIRGALGATRGRIIAMVVRDALSLAAGGLIIGLAVAAAGSSVMSGLLRGTNARDPVVYATVAAGVVVMSAVAAWLPARQAARTEPVAAMKAS